MAHRGRRALTASLVGAALLAAGAGGGTEHVQVQATLSFERSGYEFSRVRLTIRRNGTIFRPGPLGNAYSIPPVVRVRDLDDDGEPEVWVDTWTGGAHCCTVTRFYRFAGGRYRRTVADWGNVYPPYRVVDLRRDGRLELRSADDRFAYVFTSFAGSLFPVQVWRFERGRLVDVTRIFPRVVERDADELWRTYRRWRRERMDVRGVLAAWAADQLLLGRGEEVFARLERLREGGAFGPRPGLAGWPQGTSYLRELRAFLRTAGYIRRVR